MEAAIRGQYKNDIIAFAEKVITEDPHDSHNPFKPLPINDIPYIKTILNAYVNDRRLIIVKSRQVMISWILTAAALWDVLLHEGVRIALISKKSEDTRRLIERMQFMWSKLPDWKPQAQFIYHPLPRITINENHSYVFGYPQGADQLRSETFSKIISDEFAFQDDQEKTYIASKPTVDGGGSFIAVSTPNGQDNLFYRLSKDPSFKRIDVHYSMNPLKGESWRHEAFTGMTDAAIQQEYELNFLANNLNRIYPDFNPVVHIRPLQHNPSQPLFVSWDFGFNRPAVTFTQLYDGRFYLLKSILGYKKQLEDFAYDVLQFQKIYIPHAGMIMDYCDIAGTHQSDRTQSSSVSILNRILSEYNRFARYKKTKHLEDGHSIIRRFMTGMQKGNPCFMIDPSNSNLIEGFQGGYHYHGLKENVCGCGVNENGEKEKDYFKHLQDTLRYVAENLYQATGDRTIPSDGTMKITQGVDERFINKSKQAWAVRSV